MRHRVVKFKLSRDYDHRAGLFRNLAVSLVLAERIKTTEAKAKAVRGYVERLVKRAKKQDLASARAINAQLQNSAAVKKLLQDLAPRFDRANSGFLRILKLGPRAGDAAPMALVEFTAKAQPKKAAVEKPQQTTEPKTRSVPLKKAKTSAIGTIKS